MQVSHIPPPQHLDDQTVSDSSSDRANFSWICHKQTGYWQCTALSTASEANATASENTKLGGRLIDGAMRYSHATPLLKKLHWLPIAVRVEFKILLLTHRALNGQAPDYIAHSVSRRKPVRSLLYSEHSLLCVPRTRRLWGDRAFSVAAPSLWNTLQHHLTWSTMSTATFKVKLKTYLFTRIFCTAL